MCTTFSRRRNPILTPSYDLVFVSTFPQPPTPPIHQFALHTNTQDYPPTNVFIQHLTTPGFKSPRSSIEESFVRSIHVHTSRFLPVLDVTQFISLSQYVPASNIVVSYHIFSKCASSDPFLPIKVQCSATGANAIPSCIPSSEMNASGGKQATRTGRRGLGL
ncbi:hypothetical protein BDN71DRAFT_150231 [Pleurotus eryngii]|uniref:Uncharacterized protein n=1 Tax=Pleurotus eryngii TaxID=5323 RepID=A0A9P6D4J2_PLEER|nr:hypothetical protein BDN71DRAFT_150231 [Pleurotus eryngii]